jgi:glycerol-3-phosphate dehydrogenase
MSLLSAISLLLPIYTWWQLPYYYAGCKLYDFLAGKENMESAYWMGRGKALEAFPMLKDDGLVGGVVYYDGESELWIPSRLKIIRTSHVYLL